MSYIIRKLWLDPAKYHLKAPHAMTPKYVTIHNTANDASAAAEIAYMLRNSDVTSYHVAIDDKEAIQSIPFKRNAWHCGDGAFGKGNRQSVGIEICYSESGGERYEEAEANAIDYAARVLVELGLTPSAVRFHQEWSGKNCPHRILDEGRGDEVKQAIAKRYEELMKPSVPAIEKPNSLVKLGSLVAKQDVPAYARKEWGTQTGQAVAKGETRNVYAVEDGWYQLYSGEWLPSQSGVNFEFTPIQKPELVKEPPKSLKRLFIDGERIGAFGDRENILKNVADALDKAKDIRIEDVKQD